MWLLLTEPDTARLHALVHSGDAGPDSGCTMFWPARTAPALFAEFFRQALPLVTEFRPNERRYARLIAYDKLSGEERVPDHMTAVNFAPFDFVRFEYNRVDLDQTNHPILVAWANLVVGQDDTVPIDAAGVLVQPAHLKLLERPLARLISQTSVEQPRLASVVSLLSTLNLYLNPKAEPLAQYA